MAEISCPVSPRTEAGAAIQTSQTPHEQGHLSLHPHPTQLLHCYFLEGPGPLLWMSASTALLTLEELCQLTLAEDITIYYLDKKIHLQV